MMPDPAFEPNCAAVARPRALFADPRVLGLRAAQITTTLSGGLCDVWLFHAPVDLSSLADPRHWYLDPPPGAPKVTIDAVATSSSGPHVSITYGGAAPNVRYLLGFKSPDPNLFDPLRTSLLVRMQPSCDALCGCSEPDVGVVDDLPSASVDYSARDWRSLRAALVDHLVSRDADSDLSAADPAITVLEAIAHVGDLLHYRVDRVLTEATLEHARLRTSVRRLARLVDFPLSDGVSATAFVHIAVEPGAAAGMGVRPDRVEQISRLDLAGTSSDMSLTFTIDEDRPVHAALGEIAIHTWTEDRCCLPAGATSCVLVRPAPLVGPPGSSWLAAGDHLVFEVVDPMGSANHLAWAAGTPGHEWPVPLGPSVFREPLRSRVAQVVTLTGATPMTDPLDPADPTKPRRELLAVSWSAAEALERSYPVTIDPSHGEPEVTVARANIVAAHHGRPAVALDAARRRPSAEPSGWWLVEAGAVGHNGPGLARDRHGRPRRLTVSVELPSGTQTAAAYVPTLLAEPETGVFAFVVETEDHQAPLIRFRSGHVGADLPPGATLKAAYEVGCGTSGNIAANSLTDYRTAKGGGLEGVTARNPVAASGGRAPDNLDDLRRDAPEAFAVVPRRAVLTSDYATTLGAHPKVQRAAAVREWSGAWPVVRSSVDLFRSGDDDATHAELAALVDSRRMVGTEVVVVDGTPVGIRLVLDVCLFLGSDPESSRQQILSVLRPGTAEHPGVFHPDHLRLGVIVHLSSVVAAVARVPGVDVVQVLEARRLTDPPGPPPDVLAFGPTEIPVLDDDPARPDRGSIEIRIGGER